MTVAKSIFLEKENAKDFSQQIISYVSISLFIFLPLFYTVLKAILHPKKIHLCRTFDICISYANRLLFTTRCFFYEQLHQRC